MNDVDANSFFSFFAVFSSYALLRARMAPVVHILDAVLLIAEVYLRRGYVLMTHQLLQRLDIDPVLHHVHGERVPERLRRQLVLDPRFLAVLLQDLPDNRSQDLYICLRRRCLRLALQDGSLSENERNRLIRCGWNALNGREVTAE